jgi:hypothetical protein
MNFDRNGVQVQNTQPVRSIKKMTRVITIDSRDRDPTKYVKINGGAAVSDPGDYVVYLPRVFENVTSLRLKSATIQAPTAGLGFVPSDLYVLIGLEGLNRMDETASGADRAGYVDSAFAKIPVDTGTPLSGSTLASGTVAAGVVTYVTTIAHGLFVGQTVNISGTNVASHNLAQVQIASVPSTTSFTVVSATATGGPSAGGTVLIPGTVFYNDKSYDEQITRYTPAIGRLDRFHVTLRRHLPLGSVTTTNPVNAPIVFGSGENTLTFEVEYIDNVFEDVSSFETQLNSVNYVR